MFGVFKRQSQPTAADPCLPKIAATAPPPTEVPPLIAFPTLADSAAAAAGEAVVVLLAISHT